LQVRHRLRNRLHDGVPRHPAQLYEFAFHAACCAALIWMQARGMFRFQLMKLYIIVYLGYRFLTEFIRPEPHVALGLTAYQWAALAFAPLFAALWWWDGREKRRREGEAPAEPGGTPGSGSPFPESNDPIPSTK
jgi:prolipoprotein diacylglyceryltransferase